ncbi:hypothetical protein [Aquabacterium sp.]|uniref:hypothetical protein n=1 Tax=Aquabacterium sp. TaxID=1872578 RepID=UPI0037848B41
MAAHIDVYGASEFEAPGLHWSSPLRAFGEQPTDSVGHAAIVEKAESWLRENLPWVLAAAKVYGLYLHCDGAAIFLVLPGEGAPPRMAMHLIGVIEGAEQALPATKGTLQ